MDPADRRSRLVSLTPEGVRVRAAVFDAALAASPLAQFQDDDLTRLVEILRAALDTVADDASASRHAVSSRRERTSQQVRKSACVRPRRPDLEGSEELAEMVRKLESEHKDGARTFRWALRLSGSLLQYLKFS